MRKLMIASAAFATAIFSCGVWKESKILLFLGTFFFCLALIFLLLRTKYRRIFCIIFFAASFGFFWYSFYSSFTIMPAENLSGKTEWISVIALDYPEKTANYLRVKAKLQIKGLPKIKLWLYDNTYTIQNVEPGQAISVNADLRSSNYRYGQLDDTYPSSGIYLIATAKQPPVLGEKHFSFFNFPVQVKHLIQTEIQKIYEGNVCNFLKALMLGDKTDLYHNSSLNVSMSKAGLMHVVAVSGMHISFLVTLILLLFGNSKKSAVVSVILIWLFVFVTGAPPSAFRAGFMQSVLLAAPIVNRENDPPTSLSFALFVLLLLNPFSMYSISLQLSFAAVAGLQCITPWVKSKFEKNNLLKKYLVSNIACSIGVMIFTVPLTAYYFGTVQILAPLVNISVLWAVSICFCGGYLSIFVSFLIPGVEKIFVNIVTWITIYVLRVAHFFSGFSFASVYTVSDYTILWIIFVYVTCFICLLWHAPRKWKILVPISISIISLTGFCIGTRIWFNTRSGVFSAIDVGQGQSLAIFSQRNTVMIDCGNTMTDENAGEIAGKYLLSCGRQYVDLLLLTHLHEDHANGLETLLEYIPVKEIVISSASSLADETRLSKIQDLAEKHHTIVTIISNESTAVLGDLTIHLYPPQLIKRSNENEFCVFSLFSIGEYDMLVTGDATQEQEREFLAMHHLPKIDLLVVGHHGSKYSSSNEIIEACRGATAVISTGYNTFGHPHQETLKKLTQTMNHVYRTDEKGTLQFILPVSHN